MKRLAIIAACAIAATALFACGSAQEEQPAAESSEIPAAEVESSPIIESDTSPKVEAVDESSEAIEAEEPEPIEQEATEPEPVVTVFGSPEIVSLKSGSGSGGVGTCAVFHADSSECTEENLNTWYREYVKDSSDNWCVIVYSDNSSMGVYASSGMVDANVYLDKNSDGSYSEGDDSEAIFYIYSSSDDVLKPW